MIVTLDTGILVRATARSNGPARRVVDILTRDDHHTLALSRFIISEVGKALCYPRLFDAYRLTPEMVQDHLSFILAACELVEPASGPPVVLTDPKDDPVFYTALGAGADVLCTKDRAFFTPNVLAAASRHDLAIMDDLQLLSLLEQSH